MVAFALAVDGFGPGDGWPVFGVLMFIIVVGFGVAGGLSRRRDLQRGAGRDDQ